MNLILLTTYLVAHWLAWSECRLAVRTLAVLDIERLPERQGNRNEVVLVMNL